MKKLILPLLLLLGISMLLAVESAPSEVVGYVKYGCYPGFNNVATHMGTLTTAEAIGNDYLPNISSISKWNAATQNWSSISYDAEFGEWDGTMPMNNGDVMVMYASTGFDFYNLGTPLSTVAYNINPGFNYISVPLNRSNISTAEALANEVGNISAVSVWSNQAQSWSSISYDAEFGEWDGTIPVSIGDVVVLYGSATTTWPVRGSVNVLNPSRSGK